jgi:alanine racemase
MVDMIKQVVFPHAQVLQIRNIPAGSPIGYNATYRCETERRVATVAIGYADGYLRGFSGRGIAKFEGASIPVIGRVSMDLVTLDVSDMLNLREGDWVEIDYSLPRASRLSGLSQYELLTGLNSRFDRFWM